MNILSVGSVRQQSSSFVRRSNFTTTRTSLKDVYPSSKDAIISRFALDNAATKVAKTPKKGFLTSWLFKRLGS